MGKLRLPSLLCKSEQISYIPIENPQISIGKWLQGDSWDFTPNKKGYQPTTLDSYGKGGSSLHVKLLI